MSDLDKLRAPLPGPEDGGRPARKAAAPAPRPQTPAAPAGPPPAVRQGSAAPAGAQQLKALTPGLVGRVLDDLGANYEVDDDGDYVGIWENGYFAFMVLSASDGATMLQVHARWEGSLDEEQFAPAAIFANEWNSSQGLPMAFARVDDDGEVGVYGESTVDLSSGVSPAHLRRLIERGIGDSLALFDAAAEMFETPAETDDEQDV